jgi:myo-inositol-1(or 4)-monophosphatase
VDVDLQVARSVAIEAAQSAGRLLLERIDSIREVRHKSAVDLVTDVDIASEERVRSVLLSAFPTHSTLGEENGARVGSDPRYRWIIDPLDGTTNYAHGFPFFCVSIALEVEAQLALGVAYSPTHDELFVAEAGRGATLNAKEIKVSTTADVALALLATGFPYDRSQFPRALKSFEVLSLNSLGVRRPGSAVLDLCYVVTSRAVASTRSGSTS